MRLIRVTGAALLLTAALAGPVLAGLPIQADLSVLKTDAPDPVAAGSNITYTITVQNLGPGTADFVSMCDVIPAGTTFVSAVEPAGWTETFFTGQLCEEMPSLTAAAGPQVMTVIVQVDPTAADGTVITNTAEVSSETFDNTPANNEATTTTTVGVPPPTPAASLADAAMPQSGSGSPLALLGFAVLLFGALSASAVVAVRRVRN
jgi:uncharacterized repeat protein (TIGR01451 family)